MGHLKSLVDHWLGITALDADKTHSFDILRAINYHTLRLMTSDKSPTKTFKFLVIALKECNESAPKRFIQSFFKILYH